MVWFYYKANIIMNNFKLNSNAPNGELHTKWEDYKKTLNKLTPEEANKYKVIIIGTGLAGASAAATLAEKGFNIHAFSYHESPRRAHSIAAQGGINAAKNYQQDGDSVMRLFYDTIKGGDFRSREDNVYRLAELSGNIIDQCFLERHKKGILSGYLGSRCMSGNSAQWR